MTPEIEKKRLAASRRTDTKRKSQLGQFLTPASTANFMAGLFRRGTADKCKLLDAGAGIGSLTSAFLNRCLSGELKYAQIDLTAYDIDSAILNDLVHTLHGFETTLPFSYEVLNYDFIEDAVNIIQFQNEKRFTHAILNPPYKKIASSSRHRMLLRKVGIETVNLYSAFVALALELLSPDGQLVAILPRSFCNGPYYKPFRETLLNQSAIRHIHLFGSRNSAFKDDSVLQENVIFYVERNAEQRDVTISISTDDTFSDISFESYDFNRIVYLGDRERFIHIPTSRSVNIIESSPVIKCTLEDVGVSVSTGPVVDFRLKEHLSMEVGPRTAPLLYPGNFIGYSTEWPKHDPKKPNAIQINSDTKKWLYPNGCYCLVRRFSSKEEKKRVIASVVLPDHFPKAQVLGFENHLNIFHENRSGIQPELAYGISVYLNSTVVDGFFRQFNGHTQVNATDLRQLKYPNRRTLISLGKWAMKQKKLTQLIIDNRIWSVLS